MTSVVAQVGSMTMLNTITNNVNPFIGISAPTWIPGLVWINTNTNPGVLYTWNGASWVSGAQGRFIALLTADPTTTGPGGGFSVNVSDLVEDTTSGYSRQSVTWSVGTTAYPSVSVNTNALVFGPYSANQLLPVQWAAMVTSAAGIFGTLLYSWQLAQPQQVSISQEIVVAASALTLDQQ